MAILGLPMVGWVGMQGFKNLVPLRSYFQCKPRWDPQRDPRPVNPTPPPSPLQKEKEDALKHDYMEYLEQAGVFAKKEQQAEALEDEIDGLNVETHKMMLEMAKIKSFFEMFRGFVNEGPLLPRPTLLQQLCLSIPRPHAPIILSFAP